MIKSVVGFEGKYFVSDEGFLINKRLQRHKPHVHPITGYVQQTLRKDGKAYMRYMHRMVAEAFIPNPDHLPEVNHKDGNKQNNSVSNLEWVGRSENMTHAYRNGLRQTTRIAAYTKTGEFVRAFDSENDAVRYLGLSYNAGISNCLRGVTKSAHGFVWRYM